MVRSTSNPFKVLLVSLLLPSLLLFKPILSRMVLFLHEWLVQSNLKRIFKVRMSEEKINLFEEADALGKTVALPDLFYAASVFQASLTPSPIPQPSPFSGSSEELDIESVRLDPTQYLTRNYAFSDNTDNIPSSCLMMRKLPRVPCLVVLHVLLFILFVFSMMLEISLLHFNTRLKINA